MKTLKQLEKDAILASLARHDNNAEKAAIELGCCVRKIQMRMKEWGLARPQGGQRKPPKKTLPAGTFTPQPYEGDC